MPTSCEWIDEERTILLTKYEGEWTWDEFFAAADEARALTQLVPHTVAYILDLGIGTVPVKGSSLTNAKRALDQRPENTGILVFICNPFIRVMVNVFRNFAIEYNHIIYTTSSLEEAVKLITEYRTK